MLRGASGDDGGGQETAAVSLSGRSPYPVGGRKKAFAMPVVRVAYDCVVTGRSAGLSTARVW
jgi:hypothetical protein